MKILKPGKVEMCKFTCPDCGCEFIAMEGEVSWGGNLFTVSVFCPQDGCRAGFVADWEPYEEPTTAPAQTDRERLSNLVHRWRRDQSVTEPMTDYLIANGVTFKGDS